MRNPGERVDDLAVAGFVLAGISLPIPTSTIPAMIVGAIAVARGRVAAGAVIMCVAPLFGIVGALIWYDALNLNELIFYPDDLYRPLPAVR